jgi:oxygen-dependent protoporphyrinogen oxidase
VTRVAVIGGGITGLSAAYYISRAGHACTLIDPAQRLGGVIQTEVVDGCIVESGPDSFIAQKPWAVQLIRELGLQQELIRSNDHLRRTYIARRGRLISVPEGLFLIVPTEMGPLLRSRLLSWRCKLQMGMDLLRRPQGEAPDRTVAEFVRDHYGSEAVDYLAEPLLAGIYGGNPAELSVKSVLPRFVELERQFGSLTRGVLANRKKTPPGEKSSLFLSLKSGMGQLTSALEKSIAGAVRIIRAQAQQVARAGQGYHIRMGGQTLVADHVVIAAPAYAAGGMLGGTDGALAALLRGIRYHSSMTVALAYERAGFSHPLNGFGFLVPRVERGLLTACTWVGTKFPHRVGDDRVLLRAFVGAGTDEALLERPDQSIAGAIREELRVLMGLVEAPCFARVARWPRAMAQYEVGHERRIEEIRARLSRWPGLHLAGNAYLGIGIPDCIHTAQLAAAAIEGPLREAPPLTPAGAAATG